jgi:SAM-dependent methyltransferase
LTPLSRQYAKLCDSTDFEDPDLLRVLGSIFPERDPALYPERKAWEFGMLALFLEDVGRLNEETQALAIGAGDERVLFWLANRVGRVVATDIYGEGEFAGAEAHASMLADPAAHAPFPYREDRLDVRYMDARALDFPDASFDVVFSLSSFEHFGYPRDIRRAAREAGRVLRPGGHAVIVTECLLRHHPLDWAGVDLLVRVATLGTKYRRATPFRRVRLAEVFTPRELQARIVRPSGLALLQPLDTHVSPDAWRNLTRSLPGGRLEPATGEHWPHILLQTYRSVYTSVCLVLQKP